jgi:hypothetical protein
MLNDCQVFRARNNGLYFYSKLNLPKYVTVWTEMVNKDGWDATSCKLLPILDISENVLKEINVWDLLTEELQNQVKEYDEVESNKPKIVIDNVDVEKVVRKRKKHPNYPSEIACIKCKTMMKVNVGNLSNKLERLNLTIEEYVKISTCQVCVPSKGRKSGNKSLPTILKCHGENCNNEVTYASANLIKYAERKGLTINELIASYKCQSCAPSKRGKGAKTETNETTTRRPPIELKCHGENCNKVQVYAYAALVGIAEKKGKNIEELINNYKCQSCFSTKGRNKAK